MGNRRGTKITGTVLCVNDTENRPRDFGGRQDTLNQPSITRSSVSHGVSDGFEGMSGMVP